MLILTLKDVGILEKAKFRARWNRSVTRSSLWAAAFLCAMIHGPLSTQRALAQFPAGLAGSQRLVAASTDETKAGEGQKPGGPTTGRLRLKNGDFIDGELTKAQDGFVGWKNPSLQDPVLFPVTAVRSVDAASDKDQVVSRGTFMFQTHAGDRLWGDVDAWSNDAVELQATHLGRVRLKSNDLKHIRRWGLEPKILYQGPRSIQDWTVLDPAFKWSIESGSLISTENGAKIRGALGLTEKVQIDLRISWNRQPNFVFSMGVGPEQSNAGNAFSFEVWDDKLALVRDVGKSDATYLESLDAKKAFVELTIYLDQIAGRAIVFSDRGAQLADMTLPAQNPKALPCVLLENYGRELRLDAIRVQPWNNQVPTEKLARKKDAGESKEDRLVDYAIDTQGNVLEGRLVSWTKNEIIIRSQDGKDVALPTANLEELVQSKKPLTVEERNAVAETDPSSIKAAGHLKQAETFANDSQTDRALIEYERAWQEWAKVLKQYPDMIEDDRSKSVFEGIKRYQKLLNADLPLSFPLFRFNEYRRKLESGKLDNEAIEWLLQMKREASVGNQQSVTAILKDQSRIIGQWTASDETALKLTPDSGLEPVTISFNDLSAIRGSTAEFALPKLESLREGLLLMEGVQLAGVFATSSKSSEGTCLAWQPRCASQPVRVTKNANGRVDFRRADPRIVAPQAKILGGRANTIDTSRPTTLPNMKRLAVPNLTLRTGDLIEAEVVSIDEKGITFESKSTTTKFVPHDQVQSVEMRKIRREPSLAAAKMERLLTVPRQRKNDPPTHLLSSVSGDFLRGQLRRMDSKKVVMEVKLEEVEIPVDNIAQIVWLHDRQWKDDQRAKKEEGKAESKGPSVETFQVHAVERTGWKLTFSPTELDSELLHGKSDLLGDCNIALAKIDVLLFGKEIDQRARELTTNPWSLTLAKQPRVFEEEENESPDGNNASTASPLVGKAAQKVEGEKLDGTNFKLSDLKGKVVVLDFWASWCGPCMQTMPKVDEIVKKIGTKDVELIAVNLEETADRAKAAMERLKLDTTVVLDLDGVAGRRYQANAIPQTVIIDRDQVVRNVFVGGGAKFLEQFEAALEKVLNP